MPVGEKTASKLRISFQARIQFLDQLARFLKSGLPILKALEICSHENTNRSLKFLIDDLSTSIRSGQSLSDALMKWESIFSSFTVATIRSGEESGSLDDVLHRLVLVLEKEAQMRNRLTLALIYPLILILFSGFTILLLFTFVVPRLASIYADFEAELPFLTKSILGASSVLSYLVWPFLILVISFFIWSYQLRSQGRSPLRIAGMKIPFVQQWILREQIANFSHLMSFMLRGGIPILTALASVQPTFKATGEEAVLDPLMKDLRGGESFATALDKVWPGQIALASYVRAGEETGSLDDSLDRAGDYYEAQLSQKFALISSLVEPLLMIGIGAFIGIIIIGMLLPIFELGNILEGGL